MRTAPRATGRTERRPRRASASIDLRAFEAKLLPELFELGGCVFAKGIASHRLFRAFLEGKRRSGQWTPDKTITECRENHLHTLDLLRGAADARTRDASFKLAEALGRVIAHAWLGLLVARFPGQRFRVYYLRGNNPTVRFHRVYPGEPHWLREVDRPEETARGQLVILDSGPRRAVGSVRSSAAAARP